MKRLIYNIGILAGIHPRERLRLEGEEMNEMGIIHNAYLLISDEGRIEAFGHAEDRASLSDEDIQMIDAWCDPHTHIVYAGSREGEFVDKIRGLSYAEIARRGGGILNSADLLHDTSEDSLYTTAMIRLKEMEQTGTGCVEIKSGYGLTTADELKMLRVVKRMKESAHSKIVSTFLGAHAVCGAPKRIR